MKKNHEESHENHERWLLTYSDLITLLMIFFVIMYAMSSVNSEKYEQLSKSLNSAMGGGGNLIGGGNGVTDNPGVEVVDQESQELQGLKNEVDKYINENGLSGDVSTQVDDLGVTIRFKNSILFESGSAELKKESRDSIVRIGKILRDMHRSIRVEGHTDNVPVSGKQFRSNWQLSAIRATNVAELLISEVDISPEMVVALGYGEYRPIASNTTSDGRAQNRRVDIIIIRNTDE